MACSSIITTQNFDKVYNVLTTLQRVPLAGMIPAAIQTIVGLGELLGSCLSGNKSFREQGLAAIAMGSVNFLSLGFFIPTASYLYGIPSFSQLHGKH